MEKIIISSSQRPIYTTHKVLRNTYFLLGLTLTFSAIIAIISMELKLPGPGLLLMLVGFYGLMFLTYRLANQPTGILATFAFTGFIGYSVGPILSSFLSAGMGNLILLALIGTGLIFFSCSAYVLTTQRDMSFLTGIMLTGFIILLITAIANLFLKMPALYLTLNALFTIFSSSAILWETSNIIYGGETNYIRATVSLYVSLYNIFISLLSLLGLVRKEE